MNDMIERFNGRIGEMGCKAIIFNSNEEVEITSASTCLAVQSLLGYIAFI